MLPIMVIAFIMITYILSLSYHNVKTAWCSLYNNTKEIFLEDFLYILKRMLQNL